MASGDFDSRTGYALKKESITSLISPVDIGLPFLRVTCLPTSGLRKAPAFPALKNEV
jgi:hypothetical protein